MGLVCNSLLCPWHLIVLDQSSKSGQPWFGLRFAYAFFLIDQSACSVNYLKIIILMVSSVDVCVRKNKRYSQLNQTGCYSSWIYTLYLWGLKFYVTSTYIVSRCGRELFWVWCNFCFLSMHINFHDKMLNRKTIIVSISYCNYNYMNRYYVQWLVALLSRRISVRSSMSGQKE